MPGYFPDLQRYNPFRPPSWRWDRAVALHAVGRRSSPRRDDAPTRDALAYLRCPETSNGAGVRPGRTTRRFQALSAAHALFRGEDERRAEVEARVLADQPAAAIAEACGWTVAAVAAYEALFFDVRCRLRARDWVMRQAVRGCPAALPGVPERAVLWKWAALVGGVPVLEVVMAATGGRSTRRFPAALLDLARRVVEAVWTPLTPADVWKVRRRRSSRPYGRSTRPRVVTNQPGWEGLSAPLFPAAMDSLRPERAAAPPRASAGRDPTSPEATRPRGAAGGRPTPEKKARGRTRTAA